ncbi:MAG: hypothetical protein AABY83_05365 [Pseudomonadota bacterium]|mgnify:CR=1 FL=1
MQSEKLVDQGAVGSLTLYAQGFSLLLNSIAAEVHVLTDQWRAQCEHVRSGSDVLARDIQILSTIAFSGAGPKPLALIGERLAHLSNELPSTERLKNIEQSLLLLADAIKVDFAHNAPRWHKLGAALYQRNAGTDTVDGDHASVAPDTYTATESQDGERELLRTG